MSDSAAESCVVGREESSITAGADTGIGGTAATFSALIYGSMTFRRLLIDGLALASWTLRLLFSGRGGGVEVSDFFRRRKNEDGFLFSSGLDAAVWSLEDWRVTA